MTKDRLEDQLARLGRAWPTDDSFVEQVMSRVDTTPRRSDISNQPKRRLMRFSVWTAGSIVICCGLWWAFGPQSTGSLLYAQMNEALQEVQTIHGTVSVRDGKGPFRQVGETWFARGEGFSVTRPEYVRIDNGTFFWEYTKGSETASRTKSQSTDELLDQALDFRKELEHLWERHPAGDRRIDGVVHQCYRLTYDRLPKAANPPVLDDDKRRLFLFIDPKSLPKLLESEEKIDGEWQVRSIRTWEFDVPVVPAVFKPDFGEHVRVVDADDAFGQLTDIETAVHSEERDGLIYAIHQAKRFEGGGVMIMSSVRGTEETLKKYPLKRRMLQPGRYITEGPATNYEASPQGSGFFRLSLAEASHKGVEVEWWMMVPRGEKPDWFEDPQGRVQLRLGITPRGEYARENHADEQSVIHHITWDLALDIPEPDTAPSLPEMTRHIYIDMTTLRSVFPKLLNMGVKTVNDVPTGQRGTTEDVSPEQFAAATREHIRWWEGRDVEFQLTNGGRGGSKNAQGEYVTQPAVYLPYNSVVDDTTLTRAVQRPDLVFLSVPGTTITDAGLANLKGLKFLTELNIAETAITDDGLRHLQGLASLQKLNVESTQVTPAGIEQLQQALPDVTITTNVEAQ